MSIRRAREQQLLCNGRQRAQLELAPPVPGDGRPPLREEPLLEIARALDLEPLERCAALGDVRVVDTHERLLLGERGARLAQAIPRREVRGAAQQDEHRLARLDVPLEVEHLDAVQQQLELRASIMDPTSCV